MFNPKHITLTTLLVLGLALVCPGQFRIEQPVFVGREQGMPVNDIRTVRIGREGFVWAGTSEGLCRFDGSQTTIFRPGTASERGDMDNLVYSVLPLDQEIWTGTNFGVAVFNTSTETFRYYRMGEDSTLGPDKERFFQWVAVLNIDRAGVIWAGTRNNGVWYFDKKKDRFERINYPAESYPKIIPVLGTNESVLSIEPSCTNDSIIYAGTTAGLQEINKYTGRVKWYTFPHADKDYQVSLNAFRRLHHHENGLLYVGSWGAGVNVFNPVTKTFTPLVENYRSVEPLNGSVSGIHRKSADELWITSSQGLSVYNLRLKKVTWYKLNRPLENEFYGIDAIDRNNRIWMMTINGICYFDPDMQQFTNYSYEHLFSRGWSFAFYVKTNPDGSQVTVCPLFGEGVYRLDKATGSWTRYPFNGLKNYGLDRIIVRGFEQIRPDEYLVTSDEGLFIYSIKKQQIIMLKNTPPVEFKRWGHVLLDSQGSLWIAADAEGVVRWDRNKGTWKIYKKELLPETTGNNPLRPENIFEDSRHNIWFTRTGGYSVYSRLKDTIYNFLDNQAGSKSMPGIKSFAEDRNGKVWITCSLGFYAWADPDHPENGISTRFELLKKGIEGFMERLATDKEGNVWGYTKKELVRINAADLSLSRFSLLYGIKNTEFFHFSFSPDGEVIFGSRNSIYMANPAGLRRNEEMPVPYIAQLRILNNPVSNSLYTGGKTLRLGFRQNFLTILFSARAYTMAEGVKFRYRLKGFDDWNETSNAKVANYTNIPSGSYTFELQAANNEGSWNENELQLPVYIARPFYRTLFFRISISLLALGLGYWFYRYRISQVKKKEKLKTQYEKKLANVEMTALLSQMNPHFLFNSLNSIDSYIIRNESGKASEYLNNFARLMRLILQNSRSNYTSLKDEAELLDLYLQMESLRFKDKFRYEIKMDEGIDTAAVMIPPMLIQPYIENAVWHGLMHKKDGKTGKVEVSFRQEDNKLICLVEDNGIGREGAQEIKSRKPGNHKRSMGMQITQDRIDLINKLYNTNTRVNIIDLKDMDGHPAGTRVELVIPF